MASERSRMADRMKDMPPDERKRAEERLGSGPGEGPPAVKYRALGTRKKVAGYACELYRVTVADQIRETCFSPWTSKLAPQAEAASFKKAMVAMERSFDLNPGVRMTDWANAPGIPVEETAIGADGKPEWSQTLKAVTRGAMPSTDFQVPPDFTKEALPFGGPARTGPPEPPGETGAERHGKSTDRNPSQGTGP